MPCRIVFQDYRIVNLHDKMSRQRRNLLFLPIQIYLRMQQLISDIGILGGAENESCETVKVSEDKQLGNSRKLYIESYGCQMNFSDSEIVASILGENGFDTTSDIRQADLIFLNTCSIREKAETTVRNRLVHLNSLKRDRPGLLIGVLGCMAERVKAKLL